METVAKVDATAVQSISDSDTPTREAPEELIHSDFALEAESLAPEPQGSGAGSVGFLGFFITPSTAPAAKPSCRPPRPSCRPEAAVDSGDGKTGLERQKKREQHLRGWFYLRKVGRIAELIQRECVVHERELKRRKKQLKEVRAGLGQLLAEYAGDAAEGEEGDDPGADEEEGDLIPDGPDFRATCHSSAQLEGHQSW